MTENPTKKGHRRMRMNPKIDLALRVMKLFDSFGGPDTDNLWWRTDGDYGPVTMIVNCNDLFMWACADAECITPENIEALEQTVAEVAAIDDCLVNEGVLLWCCRQRGFRPQQPYYKHLDPKLHALFDACGPRVGEKLEGDTADAPAEADKLRLAMFAPAKDGHAKDMRVCCSALSSGR